jgi:hypothetical protein
MAGDAVYRYGMRCRVNPASRVAAVEIPNEAAVSGVAVTAEGDGQGELILAIGDIHTAECFPDSPEYVERGSLRQYMSLMSMAQVIARSRVLRVHSGAS